MPAPSHPESSAIAWLRRGLSLLAFALLGLHLLLASRVSFEDLRFGLIAAVALVAIAWATPDRVTKEIGVGSLGCGALLIGFGLWRMHGQPGALAVNLVPLVWGIGLALLIGGGRWLATFWREGLVVLGIALSPFVETVVLELIGLDLAPGTSQFTAALLRLCGWESSARDVVVTVPGAWIVVSQGCSGLKTMYFLAAFAVLLLLVYPIPGAVRKAVIFVSAVLVGYLVNAVRVAILALLARPGHEEAFKFWHFKQGAMLFEVIAVAVFMGLVFLLMPARPAAKVAEASGK